MAEVDQNLAIGQGDRVGGSALGTVRWATVPELSEEPMGETSTPFDRDHARLLVTLQAHLHGHNRGLPASIPAPRQSDQPLCPVVPSGPGSAQARPRPRPRTPGHERGSRNASVRLWACRAGDGWVDYIEYSRCGARLMAAIEQQTLENRQGLALKVIDTTSPRSSPIGLWTGACACFEPSAESLQLQLGLALRSVAVCQAVVQLAGNGCGFFIGCPQVQCLQCRGVGKMTTGGECIPIGQQSYRKKVGRAPPHCQAAPTAVWSADRASGTFSNLAKSRRAR